MKIQKESLYFIGHEGVMQRLHMGQRSTMYIPDSNVVLSLLRSTSKGKELSSRHKHFLSVSKQAVNYSWHQLEKWIPVNPVLALMELTKQHLKPDFEVYLDLHNELFANVYGIDNVALQWVVESYLAALKVQIGTLPSISKTIEAVYSLCPDEDKPSDSSVITSCEKFFTWIWQEKENLSLIGGPLMYISIYAICGSPQARTFIKYSKRSSSTAENVAWDLLYWAMLEFDYHENRYENTVICTSDYAMAELLASRINQGPRGQVSLINGAVEYVETFGDFSPVKFKRLENTKLEREILQRFLPFLSALSIAEDDCIKYGFNMFRAE
jgi:hypothetical protein